MSGPSLMYWNDKLQATQPHVLTFLYEVTGAKTISEAVPGQPALTSFDALTQAQINSFLLTSDEFTLAQFDSTSMGTDAFGIIVDMRGRQPLGSSSTQKGQARKLIAAEAARFTADVDVPAEAGWSMTNKALSDSTLEAGASLGANGNLAARFVLEGVDNDTDGMIMVRFYFLAQ